jgi:hypothetical protein
MKGVLLCAVLAAGGVAFSASAQTLKPGLWEISSQMKSSSEEAEKAYAQAKNMANMPPERRKKMEEMMAQRGMKMVPGGPGGMSAQMCMTKEMIERKEVPMPRSDCNTTQQERSGNTLKFAFACTSPPSKGEGVYTFVSPEAYTVKMTIDTSIKGKPATMSMDGSGKWLSADCGTQKPVRPEAK